MSISLNIDLCSIFLLWYFYANVTFVNVIRGGELHFFHVKGSFQMQ